MRITHIIKVGVFASWCLSALALAQSTSTPSGVEFEFSVMGSDRMRDVGYAQIKAEARAKPRPVAADFEIKPLRVSSQGRSDLYSYEGTMPVRLVATQTSEGMVSATRMIGSIATGPIPKRALIFLRPAVDGAAKVDLLDDSPTAFPARHIRIVNLAGQLVQGSLNGNSFRVDQTVTVLPPQRVTESVKVGVAYERLDRPVVVFDQSLRVGQNERILLVFLPPFRAGADVRVRVVRDQVQEPNEAEGK